MTSYGQYFPSLTLILLAKWTSSVECCLEIFEDALSAIGASITNNHKHSEFSLLCDALSIKSSVFCSRSTREYKGLVNYVDGIVVSEENAVTIERTIFMLDSFKGHRKCPIYSMLDDKLSSSYLYFLLCCALGLCSILNFLILLFVA